jgi:hypothetical protein
MRAAVAAEAREFAPWCSTEYLSGGLPYAHERKEHRLQALFADMGVPRSLAYQLLLAGADERAFSRVCDAIASALTAGAAGTR